MTQRIDDTAASLVGALEDANHQAGLQQLQDLDKACEALVQTCARSLQSQADADAITRPVVNDVQAGMVASFQQQLELLRIARSVDVKTLSAELTQSVVSGGESDERSAEIRTTLARVSDANQNVMQLLRGNEAAIHALTGAEEAVRKLDQPTQRAIENIIDEHAIKIQSALSASPK